MIKDIFDGWINLENWHSVVAIFNNYETYIVLFVSLLVPFWITYKSSVFSSIMDKYIYDTNIYIAINISVEKIKKNLYEIINFIDVLETYKINHKSRNNKLYNRERDYFQEQILLLISSLSLLDREVDYNYCNGKIINEYILQINDNINKIVKEYDIKSRKRLTNLELERLKNKINLTVDKLQVLTEEFDQFKISIDEMEYDINKQIQKANKLYQILKFSPFYILIIIGFFGEYTLDKLAVWSIYSLSLSYAYNVVFYKLKWYKKYYLN